MQFPYFIFADADFCCGMDTPEKAKNVSGWLPGRAQNRGAFHNTLIEIKIQEWKTKISFRMKQKRIAREIIQIFDENPNWKAFGHNSFFLFLKMVFPEKHFCLCCECQLNVCVCVHLYVCGLYCCFASCLCLCVWK